ncbi:MAG TPA: peptidoglycan-binding protein [Ilumatobacteraceae bacterium]|nr:peptidoglycan-binding protein [Ilumatobacteraceae bacterium]HRB02769.1 peptidoglycan-binding protein [Ilumatobacteraceae bacterium]
MSGPSESAARKIWVLGLCALVGVSGASWWLGARAQSPEQAAAKASEPDASWITAAVERRVLASTVVLRGDVKPEVSLAVGVPSSVEGAGVVTRVPPLAGTEVVEGQVVVEVSGRPVFVMQGDVPVYRSLQPGMTGPDVVQLQTALTRLGFTPDADGVFGEATKQAVSALYAAAGFVPVASATTAADVSAAEQTYHETEAAVTAAEATLALATAGGSGSTVVAAQAGLNQANRAYTDAVASRDEAVTNAQVTLTNAQNAYNTAMADPAATQADRDAVNAAVVQAQTGLAAAQRQGDDAIAAATDQVRVAKVTLSEAKKSNDVGAAQAERDTAVQARDSAAISFMMTAGSAGATVAQGEVVFLPTMPARVQSAVATLGPIGESAVGDGSPATGSGLVQLSAGGLVVSTTIRAGDEQLVRAGVNVELLDETTNLVYPATITQISETQTVDSSGQVGRAALITPDAPLPAELAGLNLRVTVTAAASNGEVLVVPVAAVSAGADGATRVSVLNEGATDPVDVPVTVLLTADGFAGIEPATGATLEAGDMVVVDR